MTQTESYLDRINEEFEQMYINKTYPAVSPDLPKYIINHTMSNDVLKDNDFVFNLYCDYLKCVDSLDKGQLKQYLNALKTTDVIDNQTLERQDSFLIGLSFQSERKHAIDTILKNDTLSQDKFLKIHGLLMKGTTSSDLDNYNYRKHNRNFVGTMENNVRNIHYLPLYNKDIESTMKLFFDYYNEKETNEQELFFKPFKIHLIISALQVFEDGNTRLARLIQNAKLYRQTNLILNKKYDSPTIYLTKTYKPFRRRYRDLIKMIAIDPSQENINQWMLFNLGRLEEELYNNNDKAEKVKLYIK